MVSLNRDAVGKVARALITLNRKTTTLDVKLALRKLGFYATQDEVRNLMLDITSKDGDVVYTDDTVAGFRTYEFRDVQNATTPTPTISVQSVKASLASVNASNVLIGTFPVKAANAAGNSNSFPTPTPISTPVHRDNVPANYMVKDIYGGFSRLYVNVTRAEAKALWSLHTKQPYTLARTTKR